MGERQTHWDLHQGGLTMARTNKIGTTAQGTAQTREEQIEAIMQQLRPKVEEAVRKMVERAVDVPEHEEFGAIEYEYRDAGLNLANDVRQAALASRKKGVRRCSVDCRTCTYVAKFHSWQEKRVTTVHGVVKV